MNNPNGDLKFAECWTVDAVRRILCMTVAPFPSREEIASWDDIVLQEAGEWAVNQFYSGRNPSIQVPPKPAILAKRRTLTRGESTDVWMSMEPNMSRDSP